jgi:hypothetical protein
VSLPENFRAHDFQLDRAPGSIDAALFEACSLAPTKQAVAPMIGTKIDGNQEFCGEHILRFCSHALSLFCSMAVQAFCVIKTIRGALSQAHVLVTETVTVLRLAGVCDALPRVRNAG